MSIQYVDKLIYKPVTRITRRTIEGDKGGAPSAYLIGSNIFRFRVVHFMPELLTATKFRTYND